MTTKQMARQVGLYPYPYSELGRAKRPPLLKSRNTEEFGNDDSGALPSRFAAQATPDVIIVPASVQDRTTAEPIAALLGFDGDYPADRHKRIVRTGPSGRRVM
jgi:hypothetical protein